MTEARFVVAFAPFPLLIHLQLLQKGTQLLSEMLDDASLSVLIDQVESVGLHAAPSCSIFTPCEFYNSGICFIRRKR